MPMMVSVHQASRPVTQEEMAERFRAYAELIGDAAGPPEVLINPNDPTQIAVVGQVHDLDALRERSRTAEFNQIAEKSGVSMTQLYYFLK